MRIWSLHPSLLDRQALVAGWRETLLAQAVLLGRTKGYTRHPQLVRFQECPDPSGTVGAYLAGLADEADARGYRFDRSRIERVADGATLEVTDGQLAFEWAHLVAKLERRSPQWLAIAKERAASGALRSVTAESMGADAPGNFAPEELVRSGAHPESEHIHGPALATELPAHPLFAVVKGPIASWERT